MKTFTSLKTLNKYFLRYKLKLSVGILFILLSNLAQVYIPILLKNSIDLLKNNISKEVLLKHALLIVSVALVAGFFRFLIRTTIIIVSREIEYDLRKDFWQHIQKLPTRFFQNNTTGNIMAHATNDINAVRMYIGPAVMYSFDTIFKFVMVISMMIVLEPWLTLYALVPLPLMSFLVYKLSNKIHIKFLKIQEKFSEVTTKAQESFSGIRVVKSYAIEGTEVKDFSKLSDEYLQRNMEKVKIQAFFMPMLFFITGVSVIIVVWLGGIKVIDGTMTLGEIVAFVAYLSLLIWPMIAFGWIANIIQQASASMKRLLKIFDEKEEIKNVESSNYSASKINGEIEFRNVSFRYEAELDDVLKNISFTVPSGSSLAIIGHTGSGKTSLINLLPRLFDATGGDVYLDGTNIKEILLCDLRKSIGFVPQETFLFSDTLMNNIAYGMESHTEEGITKIAEIAQLSKDVESFSDGFSTVLGERGITLSGGQKQRSSLARALAINPKILILDDSFSAVDTHTEDEILKSLKKFMTNRTSIIISHRISTVKNADQIIVLENGIIAERGTHTELIEQNGIYADLNNKQLLEKELKDII
ncbi:MAG: ABC transporter ATP-binding protein [Ignavibacteriae bacterium]|nr:ABC transporter ATP-binding protein [Ignavibacteriota bacterium]